MGKIKIGKYVVGKHERTMWLGDEAQLGNISLASDQLITATIGNFQSTVAVTGATTLSSTLDVTGAISTSGWQNAAVARTATAAGDGTGTIADGTSHITVTSGGANTIIILPTPTIGNIVALAEAGTTGYEIRTHNPASCSINGVSGSAFESAVAGATTYTECIAYPSSSIGPLSDNTEGGNLTDGQWICNKWIADGTMAVAAVSDA